MSSRAGLFQTQGKKLLPKTVGCGGPYDQRTATLRSTIRRTGARAGAGPRAEGARRARQQGDAYMSTLDATWTLLARAPRDESLLLLRIVDVEFLDRPLDRVRPGVADGTRTGTQRSRPAGHLGAES